MRPFVFPLFLPMTACTAGVTNQALPYYDGSGSALADVAPPSDGAVEGSADAGVEGAADAPADAIIDAGPDAPHDGSSDALSDVASDAPDAG
jgi:hypothetical protein